MFDLKFIVLLVLVIVSVILCLVTSLFLKRQHFFIDWQCQYKNGDRPDRPAPRPNQTCSKDEECGECPADSPEDCQDDEESCESSYNDILDCKDILEKRFGNEKQCGPKKASKERNPLYSYSKGTISCSQGKLSCSRDRFSQKKASTVRNSSVNKRCNNPPVQQYKGPPKRKCNSRHDHSPPMRRRRSNSTCECSGSGSGSEISYEQRRSSRKSSAGGRKKVDCLVFLDPSHIMHNNNQKAKGNEDRRKFSVLPVKTYNVHSTSTGGPTLNLKVNTDAKSPRRIPETSANGLEKSLTELLRHVEEARDHAVVEDRHLTRNQDPMKGQTSASLFPKLMKCEADDVESEEELKRKAQAEYSGDRLNLPACSNHNLVKLREKRKERKRTLMKLQYESGRLEDNMREWISGSSSGDMC